MSTQEGRRSRKAKNIWYFAHTVLYGHFIFNVISYFQHKDIMQLYNTILFSLMFIANALYILAIAGSPTYAVQAFVGSMVMNIITSFAAIITFQRAKKLPKKYKPEPLKDYLPHWVFSAVAFIIMIYEYLPGTLVFQVVFATTLVGGYFTAQSMDN